MTFHITHPLFFSVMASKNRRRATSATPADDNADDNAAPVDDAAAPVDDATDDATDNAADDAAARAALDAALAGSDDATDDGPRKPGRPREYASDDERRAAAARRARERRASAKQSTPASADATALHVRLDAGAQVRETRASLRGALDESEARRVALESEIARLRDAAQVRGSGMLATMLTTTFDVAFGIVATRRQQPAWMLERWEAEMMGQAWADALAPYWSSIAPYAPIGMAAVVTWGALDPRLRVEAATLTPDDFARMQDERRRQLAKLGAGDVSPVASVSHARGAADAVNDT